MRPQLLAWIQSLFSTEADQAEDLSELQCRIGAVHARLDIPTDIVVYGIYIIKQALVVGIKEATTNKDDVIDAIIYLNTMMDFAFKFMIKAYDINFRKKVESDEAFRLVSSATIFPTKKKRRSAHFQAGARRLSSACAKGTPRTCPPLRNLNLAYG